MLCIKHVVQLTVYSGIRSVTVDEQIVGVYADFNQNAVTRSVESDSYFMRSTVNHCPVCL